MELTDATAMLAASLTINSRTWNGLSANTNSNTARRAVTWPVSWPTGTRIRATLTHSGGGNLYVRMANFNDLTGTLSDLVTPFSGTTVEMDVTLTAQQANYAFFGFLLNAQPAAFSISNFRVTPP